jgi:putative transposase
MRCPETRRAAGRARTQRRLRASSGATDPRWLTSDEDGLSRTFRYVHRHYTGYINARLRVTGHLWQGRFSSIAMDEAHFVSALRYVALNPVRTRLVAKAQDWAWSSTRALIAGNDDGFVTVAPALERVDDFAAFLGQDFDEQKSYAALRKAEAVGRPVGSKDWMSQMEARTGRTIIPAKRGPAPRELR